MPGKLAKRVVSPFLEFIRLESSSGILLILAAVTAVICANSPGAAAFESFWAIKTPGPAHDLRAWINDAGMALFFLLVGLEIKREKLDGHLKEMRDAMLPVFGALGGMVVPGLVYFLSQDPHHRNSGWGIPMATDIAFALGALALLGSRIPVGLKLFLATLAIVDDLGAVLLIAIFYSGGVQWAYLAAALGYWVILWGLGRRIPRSWMFLVLGAPLWYLVHESGLHATIAGVLLAFAVPLRRIPRLEMRLHPWVTYGIMPIFALANSGVPVGSVSPETSRIVLGVVLGLVVGKPVGIVLGAWVSIRLRVAQLPEGCSWSHISGAGILGGIGFTMALFIAGLALPAVPANQAAKMGILTASTLAALLGLGVLALTSRKPA